MGQCVSALGTSNKCAIFKKAFNVVLKQTNQDGIFIAKVMFILKDIYKHDFTMVSSKEVECIKNELTCMVGFLTKILNSVDTQDKNYKNIISSLNIVASFLGRVTTNEAEQVETNLSELFNESKKYTDTIFDNTSSQIDEEAEDVEALMREIELELADELKKQIPVIPVIPVTPVTPDITGGNTNQHKEDIKHLRKLLKNKKLTDNQKEQYLKKIDSIKSKIQKQNKTDKINKCKEHIKNLQKTLKNKNITESQKQQCHHKISNYKLKMEELK